MARFFIDRPIFAWVVAILIMLAGGLSIISLPIAQYPTIAPPQINVTANYPGASAKTVEDSVTQVIEQQMKGLDGLRYIAATSEANGTATITLTFNAGVDQNVAQMQVQNKLQLATPLLPAVVQRQGLQVTKSVANMLILAGLISDDGRLDGRELADYASSHLRDPLSRVKGVGEVT
ncbi:MAG: efflux RND transporter permease subunit, partial [Candidatus Polarisedimenticolia bacterium]